jgi:dUTP pyrophosphatase
MNQVPNFRSVPLNVPKLTPSAAPDRAPAPDGMMPENMRSMTPKAPVRVINKSKNPLPKYETSGASGMDVAANLSEPLVISAGETKLIPTGLFVEILPGLEIQVRPRSGLSLKTKMRVSNSPGTIDSCYRGEIKVIAENIGGDRIVINHGDRVAQLVLCPVITCVWEEVDELSTTDRGADGFGSTGVAK